MEPMKREATARICLVGNAPTREDHSREIDAAKVVIRINNTFGHGSVTGNRTTHLFLINCGGQMRAWLDDAAFRQMPALLQAEEVLLPIHPAKDDLIEPPLTRDERSAPDGRNYADEALATLTSMGKRAALVDVEHFLKASAILGYARPEREMSAPSTGLIALLWALDTFASPIAIYGFGFDGWSGHRWDREKAFFEAMHEAGRIRLGSV
ncbi:glycosyltransferase family 29 protein [Jiella mangrovi]|uniref:Glycosyltransferase family 29 protein n=1 Tax=Jiella mangrovi TaxID=2821407 RepID=A0ABS4BCE4_9HYPH|nr:glycosyltransferase family 29 protein [Jiella mangrovi]MBP0614418.1 glycosyltransferase family 29 protein [Jiella mangrovi]